MVASRRNLTSRHRRGRRRGRATGSALARRSPWRRVFIASLVTLALAFGALFAFFLSTGCWSSKRSFGQAVDDFFFTLHTFALKEFGSEPPPFSEARYDEVIVHLDRDADSSVRGAARWHLEKWREAAAPRLLTELYGGFDRHRRLAAIEMLGKLRVRAAIPQLTARLNSTTSSLEQELILDALDAYREPGVLPALIEFAEKLDQGDRDYMRALASIARTGAGRDYLTGLVESSEEARPEVFEALVMTADPRAVRLVARHLDHSSYWIRRGAAIALSRSAAAAPILLERLGAERDDFQRELLVAWGLESGAMGRDAVVAEHLGQLKDDPIIGPAVVKTLARHDSPWAISSLWDSQRWTEPYEVVNELDAAPTYGPCLLEAFLRHEDRGVRWRAVGALAAIHTPVCALLIEEAAARDPDAGVRRSARRELLTQDKFRLDASLRRYRGLPPRLWDDWSPPLHEIPALLRSLHFVACLLSLGLAAALVLGWVRPLEPDRFRFFLGFLLVEGFLGDFLFFDDSETAYRLAAGVHTLLLAGFLVQDRAFVLRRFERLAGASLWVLVPCGMYWGAPVVADALRAAAGEFSFFLALCVLVALSLAAALPVFVSWLHIPAWLRRGLVSGVLSAFLALQAIALLFFASGRWNRAEVPDAVIATLLVVPLACKLISLLSDPRADKKGATPDLPRGSPGRLRLLDLGPTTTLRLPRERLWAALVLVFIGGGIVLAIAHSVGEANLARWGTGELVAAVTGGTIAALLLGAGWCGILCRHVIQIRGGLVRHGVAVAGAVLSRASWRRSPPHDLVLSAAERRFIRELLDGSRERRAANEREEAREVRA